MKPVKVERRKDRQKSNRKKKRAKFDFLDEHCVWFTTPEDVEKAVLYGTEIKYHKMLLPKYEQTRDSYLE